MLYLSLGLSAVLLIVANVAVHLRGGLGVFGFCGVVLTAGPLLVGFFLPPVAMLFVFLLVALFVWHACQRRRWLFLPLSLVAASAVWGFAGWTVWKDQQRLARLREELPYQSL